MQKARLQFCQSPEAKHKLSQSTSTRANPAWWLIKHKQPRRREKSRSKSENWNIEADWPFCVKLRRHEHSQLITAKLFRFVSMFADHEADFHARGHCPRERTQQTMPSLNRFMFPVRSRAREFSAVEKVHRPLMTFLLEHFSCFSVFQTRLHQWSGFLFSSDARVQECRRRRFTSC